MNEPYLTAQDPKQIEKRLHLQPLIAERIAKNLNDSDIPTFLRIVLRGLIECTASCPDRNVSLFDLQIEIRESCRILISDRTIKRAIKLLVEEHGIAIGSSRTASNGYFFIRTPEQSKAALAPLLAEIRSLARRCRVLSPRTAYIRRVHGQEAL